jgi:DNA-binding beta-propeller fold protein YncE
VGIRPNGLAYDPRRMRLLVAHVGDPAVAGSCTVSIVDVRARKRIADIPVAGRTRWAVYDPVADAFHVNIAVDADSGQVVASESIAGVPDVVFFNAALGRVYVAIGDPGVIEVFDTNPLRRHETVPTEPGAHTLSFDAGRNMVCAFLPTSHRAATYEDHA